ncbi:kinase-like domain-containing protein [Lineolata rhizophorae]|uniref:Kinase-like domain-containing protein n=1 Tax=Lineolata rhizophorae TaxID=578093 RepID=A0A6A6PAM9_9PEZI|nr:kinase-like domain-containing protein [Lineolata rhizophorae]
MITAMAQSTLSKFVWWVFDRSLNQNLEQYLEDYISTDRGLEDDDARDIAVVLQQRSRGIIEYMVSRDSPRTLVILKMIGMPDLSDKFLNAGVTDMWYPFDDYLLRQIISDKETRRLFLEKQNLVLSRHMSPDPDRHQHLLHGDDHFEEKKILGSGGFGLVSDCHDILNNRQVARKLIPRGRTISRRQAAISADAFANELAILRRVSARNLPHLVTVVGSYTDPTYFGILSTPVADMDLGKYLEVRLFNNSHKKWYGCLASALCFLHGMKIRHKDIKPRNILIYKDDVLLADFGISYDWTDRSGPTTSGRPVARDPRYCAPEVDGWESRNESADVWSLGCVYLEMWSAFSGFEIESIRQHFRENGSRSDIYCKNREALLSWMAEVRGRHHMQGLSQWISQMLKEHSNERISAAGLRDRIRLQAPYYVGLMGCRCGDDL